MRIMSDSARYGYNDGPDISWFTYLYVIHTTNIKIYFTEAVRRIFKDADNKQIENAIKDWLRNSKDREGGRDRRREAVL